MIKKNEMTETNVLMELPEKREIRIMTSLDFKNLAYCLIGVVVFLVLLLYILLIIWNIETLSLFMRDNIQLRLNNTIENFKTKWYTNGNLYTIRRDDRYNST